MIRRDERATRHACEVPHRVLVAALAGQWCITSDQVSLEGASAPSCWSVAEPEKEIVSPTFHVVLVSGALMVAVGGVLPALIVSGASRVSEAPWPSLTLRPTW